MFADLQAESDNRIVEIREYLDFIALHNPTPPVSIPRHINTAKGLIYVQLYGVIENLVLKTVAKTIFLINSENSQLSTIKHCVHALVLNDRLNSLINVNSKKWEKRYELFEEIGSDYIAAINSDVIPTDGKNIGQSQLQSIWKTFGLTPPIFNNISFGGRLRDIVTNRINIAHGNATALEVGRSVTVAELHARLNDVSAFCSYFLSVFGEYVEQKQFLR